MQWWHNTAELENTSKFKGTSTEIIKEFLEQNSGVIKRDRLTLQLIHCTHLFRRRNNRCLLRQHEPRRDRGWAPQPSCPPQRKKQWDRRFAVSEPLPQQVFRLLPLPAMMKTLPHLHRAASWPMRTILKWLLSSCNWISWATLVVSIFLCLFIMTSFRIFLLLLCFSCTGFLHDDGSSSFHPTLLKPEGGADPQLIDECQQALLTVKCIQEDKES